MDKGTRRHTPQATSGAKKGGARPGGAQRKKGQAVKQASRTLAARGAEGGPRPRDRCQPNGAA
eukprot:2234816-Amphidinium_carterae.1